MMMKESNFSWREFVTRANKLQYSLVRPPAGGSHQLGECPPLKGGSELPIGSSQGGCYGLHGKIFTVIFFFVLFILPPRFLHAQNYSTTIHKTVQFSQVNHTNSELRVYNINGPVTVEGYNGKSIQITAKEQIKGSKGEVRRGKQDLHLKVKRFGDKVIVYIDAPFAKLEHHNGHFRYEIHRDNWNWNEGDDYHFLFDIHIKMPRNAAVHASTINKGKVTVENTKGRVFASNINGELVLNHISGKTHASTINGDIVVKYDKCPGKDSEFHTINGNITAYYPADLSAKVKFKSLHGDLYTNFNNIERMAAKSHSHKKGEKTYFKIGQNTLIRVGKGGPTYQFKVLNGNVYIKKTQS